MQIEGLQRSKEELQAKSKQELESTKTGTKFLSDADSSEHKLLAMCSRTTLSVY